MTLQLLSAIVIKAIGGFVVREDARYGDLVCVFTYLYVYASNLGKNLCYLWILVVAFTNMCTFCMYNILGVVCACVFMCVCVCVPTKAFATIINCFTALIESSEISFKVLGG